MFLAVGLGPAGYALGIIHLLAHGFFKAGLFLGAGSVMHAMHDEVDIRRFGGLPEYMPITFVTFGLGCLAIIGFPSCPASSPRTPIIEAAFDAAGLAGLGVRRRRHCSAAGLTAFYMTRLVLMTFFGEKRWKQLTTADGQRLPPARVARGHDGADDPAGGRLGRSPAACCSRPTGSPSGSPRRSASSTSPRAPVPSPHAVVPSLVVAISALGVLIAWLTVGRHRVPVERPAARLAAGAGRAPRPLRERDQRGAHRAARHLADPRAGLLRQPRRRRAGQRHWPRAGRQLRPAAPAADRLRPLVRAVACSAAPSSSSALSSAVVVRVNAPALPSCWLFPLVGALRDVPAARATRRAGQAGRAGHGAGCSSCSRSSTWFAYSVPAAEAGTRFQLESCSTGSRPSAPGSRSASTASRWS